MSRVVPPSTGLVTSNVPPTVSMRSRSPVSPDPRAGSAATICRSRRQARDNSRFMGISSGRFRSPTWRCGTPCSAGTCCAPATGPTPSRNYGRRWPSTRRCRWPWTAAAESAGADPDRFSFTVALEAARDQVTAARGVADSADPADTGRIGPG